MTDKQINRTSTYRLDPRKGSSKNQKALMAFSVKDIEKFYELHQQLSMDDLARQVASTTIQQPIHRNDYLQKANDAYTGLPCEGGGQGGQKLGEAKRSEIFFEIF